jgi:hypothetical protein
MPLYNAMLLSGRSRYQHKLGLALTQVLLVLRVRNYHASAHLFATGTKATLGDALSTTYQLVAADASGVVAGEAQPVCEVAGLPGSPVLHPHQQLSTTRPYTIQATIIVNV